MSLDNTHVAARPSPSPRPAPAAGLLKVESGPDHQLVGATYPLRGDSIHLGRVRSTENMLAINDPDVSRTHALVVATSDGHRITDLQSTNGTLVNGKKLLEDEEVLLRTGDRVLVGSTILLYSRT